MEIRTVFDPEDMTFRDMRDFERVTGLRWAKIEAQIKRGEFDAEAAPIDVGIALTWLVARRSEPDLTFEMMLDTRLVEVKLALPPTKGGHAGMKTSSGGSPSSRPSTASRRRISGI